MTKGGKREGAGRKPGSTKEEHRTVLTVSLTVERQYKIMALLTREGKSVVEGGAIERRARELFYATVDALPDGSIII